ncbi:MAG: hypothetical protein EAZ36_01775 [Verrucomicrobia bacterium]|nr:MAG: hypothetical protein EAZ36_01775 [Verrucomicrobiota bacterium]
MSNGVKLSGDGGWFLRAIGLLAVILLTGCANLDRTVSAGRDPSKVREVFVVVNLNDNRGVARHIVKALQERGLRAESGPRTMLPESADAVLKYQEHWGWDFGEHLIFLSLGLHDPEEVRPYATASRQRNIGFSTRLEEVIPVLVAELLAPVEP